jgi:hypothetical protein
MLAERRPSRPQVETAALGRPLWHAKRVAAAVVVAAAPLYNSRFVPTIRDSQPPRPFQRSPESDTRAKHSSARHESAGMRKLIGDQFCEARCLSSCCSSSSAAASFQANVMLQCNQSVSAPAASRPPPVGCERPAGYAISSPATKSYARASGQHETRPSMAPPPPPLNLNITSFSARPANSWRRPAR